MSWNLDLLPPPPKWDGPLIIGGITIPSHFNLAPLAGYTNLPFRLSVRRLGGLGLATTDLVNARAILENSHKTFALMATNAEDRPMAVQIFGSDPGEMSAAAQKVESLGIPMIDINMGCPVRKVVKGGGGSAMMCSPTNTIDLVKRIVDSVRVPVTVKMRLGWDDDNLNAPYFAQAFEQVGVAAVTIHGRTREQGFSGEVNRAGIRAVVEAVERIPVIANGDVRTLADAATMRNETGCAGIAIGRGALANPWMFLQLDRWIQTGDPGPRSSFDERLDFMESHLRALIDWRGEHYACLDFRKVANWYCKAMKITREYQQTLVQLDTLAHFLEVVNALREQGPPKGWHVFDATEPTLSIPKGPNAHW
ncbi:tRNA dihydrouridine synthase DusB [Tuwongella immobilis]|uniref:tRNA-dihydrouridine synthase n=1 Tax=Tuwongella immobilis TaxID=692036 RepID=A0A6C2YQC2_9BACT|nr:tRNA dihydrouridine synthase DusB [Tuwongella immobilis]VIP03369.1 trna-u20-dihydrouridine synthase : tRNA-dihydrouridine synthase OS=Isosphaera pallida (strain ATCC 43644 / DSM 9630 / IS1B) GN=Isop_1782 PE=3 SV=1: Dus [Tuwongella immobilis]VTS04110.1 trna-u20-dihydrouridine synthase : tRNA-dihydrouridine synthase OS=Isosphaera pallida (strain ATCC 43644 / DSM 9630 / IS1B) GN=Isop_1782 PE=3 SV=1: Dus [Tuwongella immobilis]